MATQTDQRSISVKPGDQQTQSSQRRDIARSSPRTGYMQRRGEYPFGFGPYEFFRANPFSLLRRMTEEMDRMFQETGLEREGSTGTGWSTAIDVSQREGTYNIHAELPGLEPKDVKVEVENDALVIQGERRSEQEDKEGGMHRSERQYGFFIEAFLCRKEPKWTKRKRSSTMAYWKSKFQFRNSKVIVELFPSKGGRAFLQSHHKARLHNLTPHRARIERGEAAF